MLSLSGLTAVQFHSDPLFVKVHASGIEGRAAEPLELSTPPRGLDTETQHLIGRVESLCQRLDQVSTLHGGPQIVQIVTQLDARSADRSNQPINLQADDLLASKRGQLHDAVNALLQRDPPRFETWRYSLLAAFQAALVSLRITHPATSSAAAELSSRRQFALGKLNAREGLGDRLAECLQIALDPRSGAHTAQTFERLAAMDLRPAMDLLSTPELQQLSDAMKRHSISTPATASIDTRLSQCTQLRAGLGGSGGTAALGVRTISAGHHDVGLQELARQLFYPDAESVTQR